MNLKFKTFSKISEHLPCDDEIFRHYFTSKMTEKLVFNPRSLTPMIIIPIELLCNDYIENDDCRKWDLFGDEHFKLEVLLEENPDLHNEYLNYTKIRFNRLRINKNNKENYTNTKVYILTKIVDWAENNFYRNSKSITNRRFDHLKRSRFT